jgi:hypothetical protein
MFLQDQKQKNSKPTATSSKVKCPSNSTIFMEILQLVLLNLNWDDLAIIKSIQSSFISFQNFKIISLLLTITFMCISFNMCLFIGKLHATFFHFTSPCFVYLNFEMKSMIFIPEHVSSYCPYSSPTPSKGGP